MINNDGNLSTNDQYFASPPPYQVGPFGNYYMAPGTVLAGTGSANANLLGLYYYTTATNQAIQGDGIVDIGLHYVAAVSNSNGWVPLETNGIPDYIADVNGNGAIPTNATIATNAVYTNIDLSGDGLVGSIKEALGMTNPFDTSNSLALYPITTGLEPATNTFEVYVPYSLLTSIGTLELMVDGIPAANQQCEPADDGHGNTLLVWDATTNSPPGQAYYLQAHLILNSSGVSGDGPLLLFNQPVIAIQPVSQTNGLGGSVTFTTTNNGPGPNTYQWQLDGTNIPGATGSSLTITNLASTNAGDYTVIETNQAGDSLESSNAVLVVSNIYIGITMQPMSQTVYEPDTVTFAVTAVGTNLTYQWQKLDDNGTFVPIPNATGSNYTLNNIQFSSTGVVGTYAVLVSSGTDPTNSILSSSASLAGYGLGGIGYLPLIGPRQNYTFRGDTTYLICSATPHRSAADLYGGTTIEGGAVIKFDFGNPIAIGPYQTAPGSANTGLIVHGSLNCETGPYRPATLTTMDDDSQGEIIFVGDGSGGIIPELSSTGNPETVSPGRIYLNLDDAHSENSISISNLRFFYADQAVTTPTNSGVLQVWDCQFVACNSGINSRLPGGCSTNQLHNVLFADCNFAVAAQNNCAEVDAEQVTADVVSFCDSEFPPSRLCMTNCVVFGTIGDGPVISTQNVANPSAWPFQSANDGNYYLPAGSPYRGNGTVNVSPGMLLDLARKTTYAPVSFPTNMTISGQLTLFPQAARYTGGSPDLGYAYDPLDYTIANMVVQGGTITVLRGTAIGFRNDYICGLNLADNSLLTSQGTPTQPITFTDNTLVQEGPFARGEAWNAYIGLAYYGGPAFIVPSPYPNDNWDAAPQISLRFCNFYMTQPDYGVAAGWSLGDAWANQFPFSCAGSVIWNMQDCCLYGGQILLGDQNGSTANPPGSVSWINNLFEDTVIVLQPGYDDDGPYVDLPFQAYNNLFKNGVLALDQFTTSQGNWQLQNNLFDMVGFLQGQNQPLDYNYNGWWTNSGWEYVLLSKLSGQFTSNCPTGDGTADGSNDQTLTNPPPYQSGPFGNYYMATNTLLATNGSTTADQLGLYHYTTQLSQTKQTNSQVDIGLHYLAASNSPSGWVPLDTDGDGIPDYVEDALGNGATGTNAIALGETDWTTQYTVPGVWDPTNSVYDNVDLSGDGLVGQAKKALGMQPFDTSNPHTLVQQPPGLDPNIVTFFAPANLVGVSSIGSLSLLVDGSAAGFLRADPGSNDGCLITWNAMYYSPGTYYVQLEQTINNQFELGGFGPISAVDIAPGEPPYVYPLVPGSAAWNNATFQQMQAALSPDASWTSIATSWQLFNAAIGSPYFRSIWRSGNNISISYNAAATPIATVPMLNVVQGLPDFGDDALQYLESINLPAMEASQCQTPEPTCCLDYYVVCYMAGLDASLNALDQDSLVMLFELATWDANYFIADGDVPLATAPIQLMYAVYNVPSVQAALPSAVVLPPLSASDANDLQISVLPADVSSTIAGVGAALALPYRP